MVKELLADFSHALFGIGKSSAIASGLHAKDVHEGHNLGIYLWSEQSLFNPIFNNANNVFANIMIVKVFPQGIDFGIIFFNVKNSGGIEFLLLFAATGQH